MATVQECEQALHGLATKLAENGAEARQSEFNRSISCTIRDLQVIFAGRFNNGQLEAISRTTKPDAQIRLDMTSDDLISLADGKLKIASAWASGRVKVGAGMRDIIRLRSIF